MHVLNSCVLQPYTVTRKAVLFGLLSFYITYEIDRLIGAVPELFRQIYSEYELVRRTCKKVMKDLLL